MLTQIATAALILSALVQNRYCILGSLAGLGAALYVG